ncbi:cytosine deaminase [Pontivivens ytuae]|uniref:Cytosine deaminase n=1 Tax=Pontivivens ytuae TaxID=2789856 RepID=A0A7S9LVA4_9RHOB|nr:cytosine deaminase [Pontivivens ytuae]QPH55904.1 cytosine deaminase [Pontivivens ytuae]
MRDFRTLPDGPLRLVNLHAPACLAGQEGDLVRIELTLDGPTLSDARVPEVDMDGAMVFPAFVDMHTHLDKGHIWPRAANPDGTFMGALTTVGEDRAANWSAEDVRARMDFALRCAYAHGTRAIRTHLDSIPPQDDISWPVFDEIRAEWAGRIELQAACLVGIENVTADGAYLHTAEFVSRYNGVLGAVAYPVPDLDEKLDIVFRIAAERGLDVDFHADETQDPDSACLRAIAEAKLRHSFDGRVVVGHCCSLARQSDDEAERTLDLVAEAGLNIVSLPLCNLYLQDRHAGRTPRSRGVTLVHEMADRGIPAAFASDNTRDPFYAYGDLDMMEVLRQATRIAHLDHSRADWPCAVTTTPAEACGFTPATLAPRQPADLVICNARSWTELFARPQSDRIVIRGGQRIDRTLPDYRELDHLMEPA